MSEAADDKKRMLVDILKQAHGQPGNRVYVNNAVFSVSANEVTIDFFLISRDPLYGIEAAEYVSRIIIPLSFAKEMSTHLLNVTSQWEKAFGVMLPLNDLRQPSRVVTSMPDTLADFEPASREEAWQAFDELLAQLASSDEFINDLDDEKLEKLRASVDGRLKWLYDAES